MFMIPDYMFYNDSCKILILWAPNSMKTETQHKRALRSTWKELSKVEMQLLVCNPFVFFWIVSQNPRKLAL